MEETRGSRAVDKWLLGILAVVIAAVIVDGYRDSKVTQDRLVVLEADSRVAASERMKILDELGDHKKQLDQLSAMAVDVGKMENNISLILKTNERILDSTSSLGKWQTLREQGIDRVLEKYKAD